jgi:hypothetical protein
MTISSLFFAAAGFGWIAAGLGWFAAPCFGMALLCSNLGGGEGDE